MEIKIENITIVVDNGTDRVYLHTNLPSGVYPYSGKLNISFDVAHKEGSAYCSKHFPNIPVEVVVVPSMRD